MSDVATEKHESTSAETGNESEKKLKALRQGESFWSPKIILEAHEDTSDIS